MKKTLAMCIRCKDDPDCLKENIEYHTLMGVEHFFIYDHVSTIPLKSVLVDYDNVTVELVLTDQEMLSCYRKCYKENKDNFQWIAFMDTDEFIVMKNGNTDLKEFLKPYITYGGLSIWWRTFGSSGHLNKQPSVIRGFTSASSKGGPSFKTICNTNQGFVDHFPTNAGFSHEPRWKPDAFSVFDDFSRVRDAGIHSHARYPPIDMNNQKIQINHYIIRSYEDFKEKIDRNAKHNLAHSNMMSVPIKKSDPPRTEYWTHFDEVGYSGEGMEEDISIHKLIELIAKKRSNLV